MRRLLTVLTMIFLLISAFVPVTSAEWVTWVPTEEDKEFMYYFENKLTKINTYQYF